MAKEKDWFKLKKYPHIGLPLKSYDRLWVTGYVSNPSSIKSHSFYPFIHRTSITRKFRKSIDKDSGKRSKLRYSTCKPRELYYANHLDSCVYGYYAKLLNDLYEKKIKENDLAEVVTAYRRVKLNPEDENSIHKSSIDFASDVFNYILKNENDKLVVLAFDIKGFFDNLDHKLLKKAWYGLDGRTTLSEDEYNVFKNITGFSYVNEKQLFNEFKDEIVIESKSGTQKKKPIKRIHHLKNQRAIAFCEVSELDRIKSKNLLIANGSGKHPKRTIGIPQGSPISAVLANVYMIDFDKKINHVIKEWNGIYRRYSDDMIVICEDKYTNDIVNLFTKEIKERALEIQHEKTQIFRFQKEGSKFTCSQQLGDLQYPHKNLEYLGFEFDGYHSLLKSSSLSSFYRKMKRNYNRSFFYSHALKDSKSIGQIFKTRLYKKFSYMGAGRRRVYRQDKADPGNWIKTDSYNWGNYISYAQLAANKLPNNKVKGQIRRHWKILNSLIK